jgi:hypothetical protein
VVLGVPAKVTAAAAALVAGDVSAMALLSKMKFGVSRLELFSVALAGVMGAQATILTGAGSGNVGPPAAHVGGAVTG